MGINRKLSRINRNLALTSIENKCKVVPRNSVLKVLFLFMEDKMTNYQVPRGTSDVFKEDIIKWHYLEEKVRCFTKIYGYQEIRTPIFEHTEVFKRKNDSSDMVNKEMYTFLDGGQRSLTLRPEGTAGVMRSYVENKLYGDPDQPYKCYYLQPNFRYERPQKGRMRIHHQFGIEVIGIKNPMIDVEVIAIGYNLVQSIGLKDLKVLINTLGDEATRLSYAKALTTYFAPNINTLCPDCQRRFQQNPLRILDCKVDKGMDLIKNAPRLKDYLNEDSIDYFKQICISLEKLGIAYQIDDQLVRGLDYYGDTVFEVVSVNPNMGSQATVLGGGRYDHLVEYFGGPSLSGIGFGMGIERLIVACESEGIELPTAASLDVYIMPLQANLQEYSLELAMMCRSKGYKTDMDFAGKNMKAMFKTAERKAAKVVIIIGEDEYQNQTVTMKEISYQRQVTIPIADMIIQLERWFNEEVKYAEK